MPASSAPSGLDALTRELESWLGSLVEGLECQTLAAAAPQPDAAIALRLMSAESMRREIAAGDMLIVRYLVSLSAIPAIEAHRAYGEVLFAALNRPKIALLPHRDTADLLRMTGLPWMLALAFETQFVRR